MALDEDGKLFGQLPLPGDHAGGVGVRPAQDLGLDRGQPHLSLVANFQKAQVHIGHFLRQDRNGHVLQQSGGKRLFRIAHFE